MIHDSVLENSHKFDLAVIIVVFLAVAVVVGVEKTVGSYLNCPVQDFT